MGTESTFYERHREERPEIVQNVIRQSQLATLSGPYGVGKSPALADLVVHRVHGIPWLGHEVAKGPVIHIDHETPGPVYKANLERISARLGVPVPSVPEELVAYLERDDIQEPETAKLTEAVTQGKQMSLLHEALQQHPNALVLIDPLELMFRVDTMKKREVLDLYGRFRRLLGQFPEAAIGTTFNLRKHDNGQGHPELLTDPRGWLEETCGSLDILNRADVRLGMDFYDEDVKVINGVRRGEEMQPFLFRSTGGPGNLAGFELWSPGGLDLQLAFTNKQFDYWNRLPSKFRFADVADHLIPRASLSRLLERAKSLGLVQCNDGVWWKTSSH